MCISRGLSSNPWGFPSYIFQHKLQACKSELKMWNKIRREDTYLVEAEKEL